MVLPVCKVEATLGYDWNDPAPVWTDVTANLLAKTITRGRQHELGQMQPGACDLTYWNTDDRWYPWNLVGPLYGNLLTENQSDVESGTTGFTNFSNCTIASTTGAVTANHGTHVLAVTTTAGGSDSLFKTTTGTGAVFIPPGQSVRITALVSFRTSLGVFRTCTAFLTWYDVSGSALSDSAGTPVSAQQSVWTEASVTATAPANAWFVSIGGKIAGAGTAEVNYADTLALMGGPTPLTWHVGGRGGNLQPLLKVRVSEQWNLLSADASSFETTTAGWTANANCAVARSTTVGGNDGAAALRLTSSASGDMSAISATGTGGMPVRPGNTYSAVAALRSAASTRTVQPQVWWYDSGGSFISASTGTNTTDPAGAWATAACSSVVAPSTAAYAAVLVVVRATGGASEVHYVDTVGLFPGGQPSAWSIGGPVYRFTGFVESFTPHTSDVTDATMVVHCVDGSKVWAYTRLVSDAYNAAVLANSPAMFYDFEETSTSPAVSGIVAAVDSSGNGRDGNYQGEAPTFGVAGALPAASGTAVGLKRGTPNDNNNAAVGSWIEAPITTCPTGTSDFTVEALVRPKSFNVLHASTASSPVDQIWHVLSVGTQTAILVILDTGIVRFVVTDGTNGGALESNVPLMLGVANHVAAVKSGTTGPANWSIRINAVDESNHATETVDGTGNVSLTANSVLIGGFETAGVVQGALDGDIDKLAVYFSAMSPSDIAAHMAATFGFTTSSLTGDKITNVASLIGWPSADLDVDAGQFQMQAPGPLYQTSSLAYLQSLVDSEGFPAQQFFNGAGKLVFQDRGHGTPASSATFGDNTGELHPASYDTFTPILDDLDIYNVVTKQAAGGIAQTAFDATSVARYGPRSPSGGSSSLQNASDADVATMCADELARFKTPMVRLHSMAIHPLDDPGNLMPQVLNRELGDRIAANRHVTPGRGSPLALDLRIEGMAETTDYTVGDRHDVWQLVPT